LKLSQLAFLTKQICEEVRFKDVMSFLWFFETKTNWMDCLVFTNMVTSEEFQSLKIENNIFQAFTFVWLTCVWGTWVLNWCRLSFKNIKP
jgi:hypothetical protein